MEIRDVISHYKLLNFYTGLMDSSGMDLSALKEVITFELKSNNHYGIIVIVGDSNWQSWPTRFCDFMLNAPMH
ncbi:hypothetical protein [Halioxenophilus aromaticivorans]|uniref:hypothetical protein n=1 Tax=Halioxenophilus aromaticivorans TaxID=1306992 RepID=UPI0036F3C36B